MSVHKEIKRITTHTLQEMKQRGEKISMLTAYDYSMATILDDAGLDVLLVGDSASNVMAGHETTLPITLDQMIYHAASVIRAVKRAFVVVDLPFGSYQGNSKEALNSAIRIMKESGAHGVKLEGGEEIIDLLAHMNCLAKADVGSDVLPDPVPDGFVGIEVRAVAWQSDQAQIQIRRGQILAYLSSAMRRAVVPDDY